MTLEERPQMDVLVPFRDADRQVTERVRVDVYAAREQALVLHRGESAVVPDDVADRISHRVATLQPSCYDDRPAEDDDVDLSVPDPYTGSSERVMPTM
jgi:hypothetical protein